jgi:hypothetical protein
MKKFIAIGMAALALGVVAAPAGAHSDQGKTSSPLITQQLRKSGPPNVVGLNLVVAEDRLRSDGWAPRPFNTDTLFGIVIPSHYTVCHQYRPIGQKVRLLAQKYGC